MGRTVEVFGLKLNVERIESERVDIERSDNKCDAPTIVFLHDSLGCIRTWRDFPEALSRATGCNAFIYDRQGHGLSCAFSESRKANYLLKEADILLELLRIEEIEKPILFGHSDGGSIALIAASLAPDDIRAVVTEGAHVFVEDITLGGIMAAKQQLASTNLFERVARYHGDKTKALFSAWMDTWLSEEYREFNIEHLLPDIQCPVLVLQGAHDEYGSARQVESIAGKVGGKSESVLIEDARHTPHKEATEITLKLAANFIRSLQ